MIKRTIFLLALVVSIACSISCNTVNHYTFKMCTLGLEANDASKYSLVRYSPQFVFYVPQGKKLSSKHFSTRYESVKDSSNSVTFEGKTYVPVNAKFWVVNERDARDMPIQSFSDLLIVESVSQIKSDSPWYGKINYIETIDTLYSDEAYFGEYPYFLPNNTYLIINTYEILQS